MRTNIWMPESKLKYRSPSLQTSTATPISTCHGA
ncbi:MAG: hypothetical protein ACD_75C01340G0002, partial [uncultured bacterium]